MTEKRKGQAMPRKLELPPVYEKIAAAQAQRSGKRLEQYLPELLANALLEQLPPRA